MIPLVGWALLGIGAAVYTAFSEEENDEIKEVMMNLEEDDLEGLDQFKYSKY